MSGPTKNCKDKVVANPKKKSMKVAIIGSGWSGMEAARALKKRGHNAIVFESGKDGPAGTSTKYSCHAHPTGSHYNRLPVDYIEIFVNNYTRFKQERAAYLKPNANSIHGIVYSDAKGRQSRTTPEQFKERSKYDSTSRSIELEDFNLQGFQQPTAINEERIINGEELKEKIRLEYIKADIPFYYDTPVTEITRVENGYLVKHGGDISEFDKVVNATGFQKFLPDNFKDNPFGLDVVYQPVVALVYQDTKPDTEEMYSLLLLDGSNPCLMPTANKGEYLLTHCGYTLLASCKTSEEAWQVINSVTTDFIRNKVKPKSEEDLSRYVKDFFERFKPVGFNGGVIAKLKTENEFRLSFAFESPDPLAPMSSNSASNGIIHVFPGKITSALNSGDEVVRLVEDDSLLFKDGYKYPKNGMLDFAAKEIANKPQEGSNLHYACTLNPYPELLNNSVNSYATNKNSVWNSSSSTKKYNTRSSKSEEKKPRSGSITDDIQHSLISVMF